MECSSPFNTVKGRENRAVRNDFLDNGCYYVACAIDGLSFSLTHSIQPVTAGFVMDDTDVTLTCCWPSVGLMDEFVTGPP